MIDFCKETRPAGASNSALVLTNMRIITSGTPTWHTFKIDSSKSRTSDVDLTSPLVRKDSVGWSLSAWQESKVVQSASTGSTSSWTCEGEIYGVGKLSSHAPREYGPNLELIFSFQC